MQYKNAELRKNQASMSASIDLWDFDVKVDF